MSGMRLRIAYLIMATVLVIVPIGGVADYSTKEPVVTEPVSIVVPETTTEELLTEVSTEPSTVAESTAYKLSVSTVQSDLRIKLLTGKKLVTGIAYQVEITYPNGKVEKITDQDKDGRINLKNLANGKYVVKLIKFDDKDVPGPRTINVSDKVEYKPVKDILADKSSKAEDKGKMKSSKTSTPKNTIEYLESKQWSTFEYIEVSHSDIIIPEAPATEPEGSDVVPVSTTAPGSKKLYDKSGNQLYMKSGDKYVEAKESDYSENKIFYKQGAETVHYQGWQKISGKTYYYDKSGKKVTGTQVIGGGKYTFDKNGVLESTMGIDVSKWQGTIDWNKVRNSGVSFVIIRLGYRGYGASGNLNLDGQFYKNLEGAKKAGLKVGVYFYSQATSEAEAVEEASFCLEALGGRSLNYPVFLDVENTGKNGRADKNSKDTWTKVINAFCKTITGNSGYRAGLYANKSYLTSNINVGQLPSSCSIWLAHWVTTTNYGGKFDLWQYSDSGKVPGISGNVDMNFAYIV